MDADDLPFEKAEPGLRLGVRQQHIKGPVCACGHRKNAHQASGNGTGGCVMNWDIGVSPVIEGCLCPEFQPQPKSPRRKSIKREAKRAESDWATAVGGKRVPAGVAAQERHGDPDVRSPHRVWQIKHYPSMKPAQIDHAWQQAVNASRGTGKRPLVGWTTKPGPGRTATHWVIMSRDEFLLWDGRDDEED